MKRVLLVLSSYLYFPHFCPTTFCLYLPPLSFLLHYNSNSYPAPSQLPTPSTNPPYFLTNSSYPPIHLVPFFPPFPPKVLKREDLIVFIPHPPTSPQDSLVTMTTELVKAEVKDLVAMTSASPPPSPPTRPAALAPAQYST